MHGFINYSAGCKNRIVTKACQLLTTQIYTINQLDCPASVLIKLSLPIENKAEMKDLNWGVKIAIFDKLIDLFHVWFNVNRHSRQFFTNMFCYILKFISFFEVRYLKFVLKNASCDITYFVMWLSIELYNIKGIRCTLGVVILRSNFMNTCLQNKAETICALHMLMKLFLFLLRILYSRTCDCVEIFTLYFTFCFVFRNTLIKKFCSRTI